MYRSSPIVLQSVCRSAVQLAVTQSNSNERSINELGHENRIGRVIFNACTSMYYFRTDPDCMQPAKQTLLHLILESSNANALPYMRASAG